MTNCVSPEYVVLRRSRGLPCLILVSCLLLLAGCGDARGASTPQPVGEVVVFAASSLQDAFGELAKGVEYKVIYSFGGSQALVTQLSQGARADVFASADARTMQAAIAAGVVVSGTEQALVTNRLVLVTPPGDTKVSVLADLGKPGLKLALADKAVPVGNYTLQALDKLSADATYGSEFKDRVLASEASYENNVRQVLSKVQLGEAEAGIVYETDAKSAEDKVRIVEVPDEYNVIATYYIAPTRDALQPEAARQLIRRALSEEGWKVFQAFGFGPPGAR